MKQQTITMRLKKPLDDLTKGDYVTASDAPGILFRIVDVARSQYNTMYRVRPAFGLFNADEMQGSLTLDRERLKVVNLVQMGIEYARFGNLIRDIAEQTATTDVSDG